MKLTKYIEEEIKDFRCSKCCYTLDSCKNINIHNKELISYLEQVVV